MLGYKIMYEGLPKSLFGCETTVTNYTWKNQHSENSLEISIISAEHYISRIHNSEYAFENTRLLFCAVANEHISAYSKPEAPVTIASIAVIFQKLNVTLKELNTDDCADQQCLLLPVITASMSNDVLDELNILLHKYIKHNENNTAHDRAACCSIFFDILVRIDEHTRKQINKDTKIAYNPYVKKANWIIHTYYDTKLTEEIIAKEVGISSGYLSSLYKKTTKKTLSEYILIVRMRKAEELLGNKNMTTAQIATAVGFNDEVYFRRKFKQYFGINIKEYKNIKHSNTLYHPKPTQNF